MEPEAMQDTEAHIQSPNGVRAPKQPFLKQARYTNLFKIDNILLFDDDPIFLKIVKKFADKRQVPLTSVATYEQFKLHWSRHPPDLVILDYDLDSELIGTHVARLLGDTPVIIISRKTRKVAEGRQWSKNIRSFFHKKYGIPRLMNEVHSVLGVHPHRDLLTGDPMVGLVDSSAMKRRIA